MTPVQQFVLLRHEYPKSTGSYGTGLMIWQGDFTPSALSDTYRLKIVYKSGKDPKVYIVSPKPLPLAEGATRLPHTYNYSDGKQRLCLFLPGVGEWNSSKPIANTIIHWAVQWMYYYEFWLATGIWFGGGHGNWNAEKSEKQDSETGRKSPV